MGEQTLPEGVAFKSLVDSETRALFQEKDWSQSSLGSFETWPKTLQGYTQMILDLPTAAIIFWGEDQIQIYNDGYAEIMGPKLHPKYLGEPYRACWPDTYPTIHPWMERVLKNGEVVEVNRALFPVVRHGFVEEAYFTFTFSPLRDDNGHIDGILQIVTEMTESVLAENRLATLRALESLGTDPVDAAQRIGQVLADNRQCIPFALIYLWNAHKGGLQLAHGEGLDSVAFAQLGAQKAFRAAQDAYLARQTLHVDEVEEPLVKIELQTPMRGAVVLPLQVWHTGAPRGAIVLGISPTLIFNRTYHNFLRSVGRAAAIALVAEERALAREKAEEARQTQEAEIRSLANSIPQLAWMSKPDGWTYWYNDRWYDYTGTTPEEMIGWGWKKLQHPDHAERVVRFVEKAWQRPQHWEITFPLRSKTGEWRWFLTRAAPMTNAYGEIVRWFGTNTDITEQLRLEESERKTRRELQLALRSGQMATWYVNLKSNTATISAEVARIFGVPYVENEDVSHVITRVIHPDDRARASRVFAEAVRNQSFYSNEYRVIWPNGQVHWVLAQGDKVVEEGEDVRAYAGVILDITERKSAESQLKAALRARDEFLSIASHELKTPLTSLMLQAEMALRSIERGDERFLTKEKMTKFIEHTDRQTDRLTRLVDDMLDISRIRAGKLEIQLETLSLSELTAEVVDRLRPVMSAAGTPVTYVSRDPLEGGWDRLRLEQVATNLLTNAMRYGAKNPITVELTRVGKMAHLEVRDQGLGIAPGALERIFNRFERLVDAKEVSGLGLGLYITRKIVSAHGGRIWAESAGLGRGSTFIVELPIVAAAQGAP